MMTFALPVNKIRDAKDSAIFEQGSAFDGASGVSMLSTTRESLQSVSSRRHHQPVTSHVATMKSVDGNPLFSIW